MLAAELALVGDRRTDRETVAPRRGFAERTQQVDSRCRHFGRFERGGREGHEVERPVEVAVRRIGVVVGDEYAGLQALERLDAAEVVLQLGVALELPAGVADITALLHGGHRLLGVGAVHVALRQSLVGGGDDRQGVEGLHDRVEVVLVGDRVSRRILVLAESAHVHREAEVAGDLCVDVRPDVEPFVGGVRHDAVLIHQSDARVVLDPVVAARRGDVVLVGEAVVLEEQVHPVRFAVGSVGLHLGDHLVGPHGSEPVHFAGFVVPADVVLGVEEFGKRGVRGEGHRTVVGDLRGAFRTAFGRDENDAVGAADAVDRRCGGVLENRDGGDVVRIDRVDHAFHAVHQTERARIVERGGAADQDRGLVAAGLARTLDTRDTGQFAGHHVRHVGHRGLKQLLVRYRRDRTHEELFLLRAVTDYHHLVHFRGVFAQAGVYGRPVVYGDFYGLVTDETEYEDIVAGFHFERVGALRIRRSSPGVVTLDYDRSSRNSPPLGAGYPAGYGKLLSHSDSGPHEQHREQCRRTPCRTTQAGKSQL